MLYNGRCLREPLFEVSFKFFLTKSAGDTTSQPLIRAKRVCTEEVLLSGVHCILDKTRSKWAVNQVKYVNE